MGRQSLIGEFEQLLLLAILHLGNDAYGVEIIREVGRRTGRTVSRSSLYITFDRMEAKGYLKSTLGRSREERGGRPRRYVEVTSEGKRVLGESRRALFAMWSGLESVLEEGLLP